MLLELFRYFAKFPLWDNAMKGIATKGESYMPEYAKTLEGLATMGEHSLIPEIEHYVYGQSFDELKERLSKLTGSFLFADYGEMDMQEDGRRSLQCTQRIAVTVAFRLSSNADMLERIICSDRSLQMVSKIHAQMMADSEQGRLQWMERDELDRAEYVPFVSAELQSYGWTLMLSVMGSDLLAVHEMARMRMKGTSFDDI